MEPPHETRVPVRYRDLDAEGHVNNVVYGTYMEEARVAYLRDVADADLSETGIVLASLSVEFESRITGGAVTVETRVPEVGETSLSMEYVVRREDGTAARPGGDRENGDVAATGETTVVAFDYDAGEPRPVPERWRSAVAQFEGHADGGAR